MNTKTAQAFGRFERFANFERSPSDIDGYRLDRISAMLEVFGHPEDSVRIVHIAGSKGKGSTAHIVAGILAAASYKVGIYASPHLLDYRERICGPHGFFSDEAYENTLNTVYDWTVAIADDRTWTHGAPTTFEMLTLSAFLIFREMKLDWAVIETGLGGRLDATNAVKHPEACLISAIELEHTEVLGDTIELIAGEKAGIFKPGAVLVAQTQAENILSVFRRKASELGSRLETSSSGRWKTGTDGAGLIELTIETGSDNFLVSTSTMLWGHYQAMNASLAATGMLRLWERGRLERLSTIRELRAAIETGIRSASPPGRLERYAMDSKIAVVLDVSHTPNSVREALDCAREVAGDRPCNLLFGSVAGKRHDEMAEILAPHFDKIWITTPGTFKASDPVGVHSSFQKYAKGWVSFEPDTVSACREALTASHGDNALLLICGSFYLAGLALPVLTTAGYERAPCL